MPPQKKREKNQLDVGDITYLHYAFKEVWASDTSSDPANWSTEQPSYGHDDITSLVLQDYFGGSIRREVVKIDDAGEYSDYYDDGDVTTHFYNRINSRRLDLTAGQLPDSITRKKDGVVTKKRLDQAGVSTLRDYLLDQKSTQKRYWRLSHRLQSAIKDDF